MTALDRSATGRPRSTGGGTGPSARRATAALEAEQAFLLRSIEDLDAQHAAGELSDARYRDLRDGYTSQAATVLRALGRLSTASEDVTEDASDPASRRRGRARLVVPALVVVLALSTVGVLVGRNAGQRAPGGTITGNAQSRPPDLAALAAAATSRPGDARALLDYAHALLGAGQTVDALKVFDDAATIDSDNAEALAYGGWIVALGGLTDEAMRRLDRAVAAEPSFPDAHFFRGMTLLRGRNDRAGAVAELELFVRLAPAGAQRDEVEALVSRLQREGEPAPPDS